MKVTWDQIKNKRKALDEAVRVSKTALNIAWEEFRSICKQYSNNKGFVTSEIECLLSAKTKNKSEIMILDHGCGGGLICLYLIAIGYSQSYGVNVNSDVEELNKILLDLSLAEKPRFFRTNGRELPFKDATFDFIYSKQVLEHVKSADIEIFYAEESRVGKHQAMIFHELPHLFQPYDSHSRLFFAHWMPTFVQPFVYGVMKTIQTGENCIGQGKFLYKKFNGDFLTLRSPFFHYKLSKKYFGSCVDISETRLMQRMAVGDYDCDSVFGLRRVVNFIVKSPVAGRYILRALRYCFVVSTVSINHRN